MTPIPLRSIVVALLIGAAASVALVAVPSSAAESTTLGVVDQATATWYLRSPDGHTTSFIYGNPGDLPMMGDWDCDGTDTPGLYRPSDGYVYLRNSNTQGIADVTFYFGDPGDVPLAGDFDGDGCDTVSVYRPAEARIFIIDRLGSGDRGLGAADHSFVFGDQGDVPFVGDFDGDGVDTIGLHRPASGTVFLTNRHGVGEAEIAFGFGDPDDRIIAGDWFGSGFDTVGAWRSDGAAFHLRATHASGHADATITYGNGGLVPIAGIAGPLPGGDAPPPRATVLDVVSRSQWGARPPELAGMVGHTIDTLTVHHAGDHGITTGPIRYRSWQAWHMHGKGWPDISYHMIVGVDGTVYEGRDTRFETDTFTDYDTTGHFQVVLEGNFDVDRPTRAQIDSLAMVLAWASEWFGVSPGTISGHGDHAATACPGEHLHERLESGEVRERVERLLDEGGVTLRGIDG